MDEEKLNGTIQRIYDAALDERGWPHLLEDIRRDLGAASGGIFAWNPEDRTPLLILLNHLDDSLADQVAAYYHKVDPWLTAVIEMSKVPTATADEALMPRRMYLESEMYQDLNRHHDIGQGVFAILDCSDNALSSFALYRDFKSPSFDDQATEYLALLQPHLRRGLRLFQRMAPLRSKARMFEESFSSLPYAAILLERNGTIVEANNKAQSILRDNQILGVHRNRLWARPAENDDRLSSALSRFRTGQLLTASEQQYLLHLKGSLPSDGLRLMLIPLGAASMSPISGHLRNGPFGILVIITPLLQPEPDRDFLMDQFNLTDSEARVAQLFARGLSPADIAARRSTKLGTVQNQIKSLKEKVGVHSQTQLLIELLRFAH